MSKTNFSQFDEGEDNSLSDAPVDFLNATNGGFVRGRQVPNKFPSLSGFPYRIAIVGEAPGKDEELQGQPFVGMSGKLLTGILTRCGIVREACFIGNLCQFRPPKNDIAFFYQNGGTELQEGLEQLKKDLATFKPNIVLLLGKTALLEAKGVDKITLWRGTLFIGNPGTPFEGLKCITSFHPAFILRQYSWSAYLLFDVVKAKEDATSPELVLPERNLVIDLPCDALVEELNRLNQEEKLISVDLEGYWHSLSCCSIANSADYSFIVPFSKVDGSHYWDEDQEFFVWKAFIQLLENPRVPKLFQNGLYDRFVLQYGYGIVVRGNMDDTMLKFWEWRCELRRKLSVQASILTKETYWKGERIGGEEDVEGH